MDKVQNTSIFECHAPTSEPFKSYALVSVSVGQDPQLSLDQYVDRISLRVSTLPSEIGIITSELTQTQAQIC
jgi:hypothetical protein